MLSISVMTSACCCGHCSPHCTRVTEFAFRNHAQNVKERERESERWEQEKGKLLGKGQVVSEGGKERKSNPQHCSGNFRERYATEGLIWQSNTRPMCLCFFFVATRHPTLPPIMVLKDDTNLASTDAQTLNTHHTIIISGAGAQRYAEALSAAPRVCQFVSAFTLF